MRVAICIPSGDMVHMDFCSSLVLMVGHTLTKGINIGIVNHKASLLEIGRCELVAQAKALNADKILFLDTDMTFPPDTLERLVKAEKPVVCCDAVRRRPPYTSVLKDIKGEILDHKNTNGLIEISKASTAVCLIDMKVLDAIGDAPFRVIYQENKTFLGEDYYFSDRAKEVGASLWCDMDLSKQIGHIGTYNYKLGDLI